MFLRKKIYGNAKQEWLVVFNYLFLGVIELLFIRR